MADCGAAGSALDRVLGSQNGANKALASFIGHAALLNGGGVSDMPEAPPAFLVMENTTPMRASHVVVPHVQPQSYYPQHQHHLQNQQHPYHHTFPPIAPSHFTRIVPQQVFRVHEIRQQLLQQQQQQQQRLLQQQQQQQYQQQMLLQQQQQQQLQPDHIAALQGHVQEFIGQEHEQQQYSMETNHEPSPVDALRDYLSVLNQKEPTDSIVAATQEINQMLQEWEQQPQTNQLWNEGRVQPATTEQLSTAWRNVIEDTTNEQNGETNSMGVSIEELSAAWAQAESDYDAQDYANMANAVYNGDDVDPYEFATTITEPQRQIPARNYLEEGLALFEKGEITHAIASIELSLQLDPDSAKGWLFLGKAHAEHDEDRKAIACLERAVDTDPYSTDALLSLGVSYVNELNHTKALQNLRQWITHNPRYAGLVSLDNDLYSGGAETELDQVQSLLTTALNIDPTAPEIHEALGVVYNVSRDYDAAVKSFHTALETRPNSYSLWNKLGATLANSNQSADALPAYHQALTLRPKYARAWLNMAISHSNLQNYEDAARCYLQTLSLNPGATHCWSYVRIALSCLERWDLLPLVADQNLNEFQQHFDFVLYE